MGLTRPQLRTMRLAQTPLTPRVSKGLTDKPAGTLRFQNNVNPSPLIRRSSIPTDPIFMFNWFKIAGLFITALMFASAPSSALAQDSDQSEARAFLVTPLSFVKQFDLDFGQIIPGDTDGTVVMDSTGAVTTTGGVIQINGTQRPARFWGFGAFEQTVLINVDANVYTLVRDGGTETMLMDQILIGSQPPIVINTNPRRFRIINPDGFFSFTIAGRLQVASDQAPGVYTGEFAVTLEYE